MTQLQAANGMQYMGAANGCGVHKMTITVLEWASVLGTKCGMCFEQRV